MRNNSYNNARIGFLCLDRPVDWPTLCLEKLTNELKNLNIVSFNVESYSECKKEVKKRKKKLWVESYWPGYRCGPTPGRDPTTARHGDFWLLGFPSGPVRLSLANLANPDSSGLPILMASLARTPSLREPEPTGTPRPQTLRHN